jgi:trigger factor
MQVVVTKLAGSIAEITGELEEELFEGYFKQALKRLGENLDLPGFRKGKAPENVLVAKIPEVRILEEMAELALAEHYPKILEQEKIDAIGRPEISITKLARKNPLGFKIKTAVLPEIKLPNYKDIAKKILGDISLKKEDVSVSAEEVENTIMDIRKSRAPKKHVAKATSSDPLLDKERVPKAGEVEELPEFNDEFVQALGPFKDVADFKIKLKENIKLEKANTQKEKSRLKIMEKIIDDSSMELPDILIEIELDKILYRMESDITQMGLKFEDYLKHMNKTKEDLRKDFRKDGEKKAKLALILNEIAKAESIVADEAQVAKEVEAILAQYKDADPERAKIHAENVLANEKIFQFLENQ